MTALAWLLLALLIIGPGAALLLFVVPPEKPTRCPSCGSFKLPRAAACFDCTTR